MELEELLGHLPKLVVVVGIMYFMFNPEFRHQNTIHPLVLFFVSGMLLTIWLNTDVFVLRNVLIVFGILLVVCAGAWTALQFWGKDALILLNVTRKDGPQMEAFLRENGTAIGLEPNEIRYNTTWPFLVLFDTKNRAGKQKIAKETETFIRKHIPVRFFNCWTWLIVGLTLIAILWRF